MNPGAIVEKILSLQFVVFFAFHAVNLGAC